MTRKGSKPQKGPNRVRMKFSCFRGGDTPKSWAQTKFEAKSVEFSPFRTERTIGPKNAPCPKPLFSDRNWKFTRCQSRDIVQAAELAKFQIRPTACPKVMGLGIFGPKNGAMPKIHYATPTSRILLGSFVAVGAPTESWKFGPNSPCRSLVRTQRNLGPKISTGPKKRIRA